MAKHRRLAWFAGAETTIAIVIGSLLGTSWGLAGFVIGLASAATLFRGLGVFAYICAVMEISPSVVARKALVPPVLAAIAPCLLLHLLVSSQLPTNWPMLFTYTAIFSIAFGACAVPALIGRQQIQSMLKQLTDRLAVDAA